MSEYGSNASITGSLNVDGSIDLGSGDDDVNLDSNTLFVDADQNKVGIGTTSPDYTLDVAGDIGVDQYIYHNGDADTWMRFGDNAVTLKAGNLSFINLDKKNSAPHELTFNDGSNNIDFIVKGNGSNEGNPAFKVDASTGRVGINGVGSPDVELHVDGDIKLVGNDPRIKIDGDVDSHPGLELYENGTRKWIAYNNYTNDNLTFKTNSDIRMVIEQDGNVGIGVGDPDTQLEVFNAGTQLKLSYNGSDAATFAVDDNGYLTITPSGGLMATGMLGHKQYVGSALSNGATLTTSQSGILIPQSGNATPSNHVVNLPSTAPGITYTFWYAGTPGQGFQINPASGEKFMGNLLDKDGSTVVLGSNGVGRVDKDLILGTSSDIGHFITIVGSGSGFWMITNSQGDWSLES